jgi:hypothetical protein
MATSTIPAFKAALQTQLQARAGLDGVQVSYGYPGPLPEVEYIWLADVKGHQDLAVMGNRTRSRDEDYTLTILIKSEISDISTAAQQTVVERAFTLMAELEDQLRTDPGVNGTVRVAQIEGPIELVELAGANARGALLTVSVRAQQRI